MILKYYNGTEYIELSIIDNFSTSISLRELKYSNITVNFDNYTISDLPIKYQEVEIYDNESSKIFFGYVSDFKFPTFITKEQVKKLEIELLSPYAMAINKIVTIIGEYELKIVMDTIFAKLISEGYSIYHNELDTQSIYLEYVSQTIEYIMNDLSNKYKFYWHIDTDKKIIFKYINELKDEILLLDEDSLDYSLQVTPKVQAVDYANSLYLKNVRLYDQNTLLTVPQNINDKSVKLLFPFDIGENPKRIEEDIVTLLSIDIEINTYNIRYQPSISEDYIYSSNIGFVGEDEENPAKTILLQRDNFFKNLITDIYFKGTNNVTSISSSTSLKYATLNVFDVNEINLNKGKVNTTGIIEKTIDLKGNWFLLKDIVDFAKSKISLNATQTNEVEVKIYDSFPNITIGDVINFEMSSFFITGRFLVTDIIKKYSATKVQELIIKCRNSNILENYSDFYRDKNPPTTEEQLVYEIITPYHETTNIENIEIIANEEVINDS